MKEVNSNWCSLPVEVLTNVFQLTIEERPRRETSNFVLVCKAWLQSAQLVLYSKINIDSLPQLRKFHNTVGNNTELGKLVKDLYIQFDVPETHDPSIKNGIKSHVFNSLSSLLSALPNLEELCEFTLYSYTATLDTLLDGGLKKLRVLGLPNFKCDEKDMATYITCVLLMKDRLENLFISDSYLYEEELGMGQQSFKRLYKKLDKFDKLRSISIKSRTNGTIQVLENVTEKCKFLKEIYFYHAPTTNESNTMLLNDNNISIETISNFTPATNIGTFKTDVKLTNNQNLLLYIIYKFPQLHTLCLDKKSYNNSNHQLHNETLTRLLSYLSNINSFSVSNIKVDNNTVWNTIGSHWKGASKNESKRVEFSFTRIRPEQETQAFLGLSKGDSSYITSTSFKVFVARLTWNTINDFLYKDGTLLSELQLTFENVGVALDNCFFQRIFSLCPGLQRLHLSKCRLKRGAPYFEANFSKRVLLHELYLDHCNLLSGLLEQWSLSLPELKCLRLHKITYHTSKALLHTDTNSSSDLAIVMPCTKIDLIVFKQDCSNEKLFLKVFVSSHGTYHYYHYNPSKSDKVITLTEQECTNTTNSRRIFICCQTKPKLRIEA